MIISTELLNDVNCWYYEKLYLLPTIYKKVKEKYGFSINGNSMKILLKHGFNRRNKSDVLEKNQKEIKEIIKSNNFYSKVTILKKIREYIYEKENIYVGLSTINACFTIKPKKTKRDIAKENADKWEKQEIKNWDTEQAFLEKCEFSNLTKEVMKINGTYIYKHRK